MITQEDKEQIKQDEARELIQESREEAYYQWQSDNKDSLVDEYLEMFEDNFNAFCKNEYNRESD